MDARGFDEIYAGAEALLTGERDVIANAANLCSFVSREVYKVLGLPEGYISWFGFYLMRPVGDATAPRHDGSASTPQESCELVLGPFWGNPACVRIAIGRGVCGTCVLRRETIVVDDVHAFPGHIACDSTSHSEIVIPLIVNDRVVGVLDVDSQLLASFSSPLVRAFMEKLAALIVEVSDWTPILRELK